MGVIFDRDERIVPTWLAVARYLQSNGGTGRNLLLEIPQPGIMRHDELAILRRVNEQIVGGDKDLSIETVASTIFPQGLYARHGRPAFYQEYQRLMARAKRPGSWGLYFDRMTRRVAPDGVVVNPLEEVIKKLKAAVKRRAIYQSTYELSPSDPAQDIVCHDDDGAELATYDPINRKMLYGGPCLSHLSFKITDGHVLDLTAIYRSHHYCERALGNLLGLGRLQKFVAQLAGLDLGTLTCISTHAELDFPAWGGVRKGRALLASL